MQPENTAPDTETTATPDAERDALAATLDDTLRKEKSKKLRKGDRVKGRVTKIGESMAFIDMGGKGEGFIDLSEHRKPDGTLDLDEGQPVEAIVVDVAANGVLLRRALVPVEESLQQIAAAHAAGLTVQATVSGVNKGGLELELFGVRAFCPASQVELAKVDDFTSYVGKQFEFRIQEVDLRGKKVVLSRRALLAEDHDKKAAEARAKLSVGAVVKGKVTRIEQFGAFVDLGGIEGLVHLTELSRARVFDASKVVTVGQEVEVQVLRLEETNDKSGRKVERIGLSMKALAKDPWENAAAIYVVGTKVSGTVKRLQPFGAFVEVAPGVDGLVHVSEIADKRIAHPNEVLKEGDVVQATVLSVDPSKQQLKLTLKEKKEPRPAPERRPGGFGAKGPGGPGGRPHGDRPHGDRPHGDRPERRDRKPREPAPAAADGTPKPAYPNGSVHDGVVARVEPFGVFLTLPGGGEALVPNAELGFVKKDNEQKIDFRKVYPVGTTMRVAVIAHERGKLKASKVEAERADERAMVKEWAASQAPKAGGRGFGTLGDLLRKASVEK